MNWKWLGWALVGGIVAKQILSSRNKANDNNSYEGRSKKNNEACFEEKGPNMSNDLYEVRIKGTIHCNGPKPINKVIVVDKIQAQMFQGPNRYAAIENWIRANYPGAEKLSSYRGFACEVRKL